MGTRRNMQSQEPGAKDGLEALIRANDEGNRAFHEARLEDAAAAYEKAVRALRPEHARAAVVAYENLGLAYFNLGRYHEAMRAFLRALDGRYGSREQSLRFLTSSAAYLGRLSDGIRFLEVYEKQFGGHPDGWTGEMLEELASQERKRRARVLVC